MSIIQGNAKQASTRGFYNFPLEQSLRFNDDDSAYLSWTPASAGDQDKWTWSAWVKRADINTESYLFSAGTSSTELFYIQMRSDSSSNVITIVWRDGSTTTRSLVTDRVFRDPSAWYHIVLSVDTANATTAHKMRLYINSVEITDFSADSRSTLSASSSLPVNSADLHTLGRYAFAASGYLDGYMAEVNFIDGQALTADSFGELKNGVWIPKDPSELTYGTNGFRLSFAGNTNDSAGSNNWTANSVSSYDYVSDSPTNNFAVLNPEGTNDISSFSQGNLQITTGSGASSSGATMGMSSGKWYAEFVCTAKTSVNFGIALIKADTFDGDNQPDEGNNVGYFWVNNATINHGFASDSYGSSFNTGDIMGVAFDADTLALQFYINNSGQGNYTRVASEHTAGDAWIFGCGEGQGGATATFVANFGQDSSFAGNKTAQGNTDENGRGDFYYAPPSGYLALCTANLPDPVIDPAQDASPADHFNTVLYTGDGTAIGSGGKAITGVGFQPDLVWIKERNGLIDHAWYDVVRGTTKQLESNTITNETTESEGLTAFGADGFTVGNLAQVNTNNDTYVAWNWKAGGAGSANSEGSVTTTSTSANTASGFSLIKWTGDGTIGHGLDEIPEMFIVKDLTASGNWWVWHKDLSNTSAGYLQLNSPNGENSNTSVWRNAYPATATTIDVNTSYLNYSTDNYLAYCFHSVEGFSSFGKYIGNGSSTDGPFVYTGFRPAFVMTKRSIGGTNQWIMVDTARSPQNVNDNILYANLGNQEVADETIDFDLLSNGFKLRSGAAGNNNTSGSTYIYMAFAENPFKYSNAR